MAKRSDLWEAGKIDASMAIRCVFRSDCGEVNLPTLRSLTNFKSGYQFGLGEIDEAVLIRTREVLYTPL